MEEILCSVHNYTKFSGFPYSFYDMAQAALDCGIDAVITTDKNIYPSGHDRFYYRSEKSVLVICGEELFDPLSETETNYLSLGIDREQFNRKASNLQDEIRIFLRKEPENNLFRHIELINSQTLLTSGLTAGLNDFEKNIKNFDTILNSEQRFSALAGTCSQPDSVKYTYQELFSTACNHIISEEPLSGDLIHDKLLILKKIKAGNLYIALDGLHDARGFAFTAEGENSESAAFPGDSIYLKNSITLKISCPESCTCRLFRNGTLIKEWLHCKRIPYTIYDPGYYRVECALTIRRNLYTWIVSNPIYVVKG